ncbi:MAG: hypothetical protein M3020_24890, partial [Myxococcota bacterium]|nr:hypothetical protein [Myxococcota bacterium]
SRTGAAAGALEMAEVRAQPLDPKISAPRMSQRRFMLDWSAPPARSCVTRGRISVEWLGAQRKDRAPVRHSQ